MDIRIIKQPINRTEAKEIALEYYIDMVKGVCDVERGIIALGGEYHMDANMVMTADGSVQKNVWGEEANTWSFRKTLSVLFSECAECTEPVRF